MTNGSADRQRVEILLVEDNPGDVRLVREAFCDGRLGNDLHVVTDGAEALEFCEQRGDYEDAPRPDVVLLDWNLPQIGGDEVLEKLGDDPEFADVPVVVLTSSDVETDVVRSYELGANAYLTKPVNPDEFVDVVQSFEEFWIEFVRLPNEAC